MKAVSFLLGGLVGAAVTMLFAPRAGRETRRALRISVDTDVPREIATRKTREPLHDRVTAGAVADTVPDTESTSARPAVEPAATRPRKSRKKAGEKKRAAAAAVAVKPDTSATRSRIRRKRPREV